MATLLIYSQQQGRRSMSLAKLLAQLTLQEKTHQTSGKQVI
jgi:hypothetical protein